MALRLYNRHTSPIDGVAPGAAGEFDDVPGVRAMVKAGLLSSEAAGASEETSDLKALVAKLEAENAALRAELDAARASAPRGKKKVEEPAPTEG